MPSYIWLVWLPTYARTSYCHVEMTDCPFRVIFESLLFLLTLVALLSLDSGQSFSDLTVILYRDGEINPF